MASATSSTPTRSARRLAAELATPALVALGAGLAVALVDNGIKYTPPGGRVVVRARRGEGAQAAMVEIAGEDSGVGVPAQDLSRLTFFRVDKARSRELGGTGLGLAIVKHIVQAHGGSLHVESALGQGTTVTALVPISTAVRQAS